jgi:predicted DNA-binding transcriptional regulator AlpA
MLVYMQTQSHSISQVNPDGLLRLKQVLQLIPIAPSSWWAGVKSGKYPTPVKLGPRTTAWRAADILRLIERAGGGEGQR